MKTLVGTPDPEPNFGPQYVQPVWSGTNTTGWVVWHGSAPMTVSATS